MGRLRALLLAGLLLQAGCIGGSAPRDRHYRLEASAPADALPAPLLRGSLRVAPFRGDGLTRGTALVFSEAEHPAELRRYSYHHWVDSPTVMLQRETTRYLRAAGLAQVVQPPDATARADFLVGGRILRMERVLAAGGSHIVLELELDVTRVADRDLLFHGHYLEQRPASSRVRDAAEALNAALDAVLGRFLTDLREDENLGVTGAGGAF